MGGGVNKFSFMGEKEVGASQGFTTIKGKGKGGQGHKQKQETPFIPGML